MLKKTGETIEKTEKKIEDVKKALYIGGMCAVAYMIVYIARNMLSAVTPKMLEKGTGTSEHIAVLSSAFFLVYAMGQLINGILGDRIREKYMISGGLLLAGITEILLIYVISESVFAVACYALMGFGLSMIYAPMVRFISENTDLIYAEKCNLALSFAALFGAPIAGVIAGLCTWEASFEIVGFLLIFMGIAYYLLSCGLSHGKTEERNVKTETQKYQRTGIRSLIKRKIILFTLISALTGIVRTSVVFWMPTYISQHLGFSTDKASLIFSVTTLGVSLSPFLAMFIYERLKRNMEYTLLCSFAVSAAAFLLVFLVKQPVCNIFLLSMAVLMGNCVSSMIWVVYCPSLSDTGMVSTTTGYLDFISYAAASVSNIFFGNAVAKIGWGRLILVWAALMGIGAVAVISTKRGRKLG